MALESVVEKTLIPFSNFSRRELNVLNYRLISIELENFCRHACIVCSADSNIKGETMPWEIYKALVDGIQFAKMEHGVDMINGAYSSFSLFRASDPVSYVATEGSNVRTFWDVAQYFKEKLGYPTLVNTSGWDPENENLNQAMKSIIENYTNERDVIHYFSHSFKTVQTRAIRDYHAIVLHGNSLNYCRDEIFDESLFFSESRFVQDMQKNFEILRPGKLNISIQYIGEDQHKWFPMKMHNFSTLFSGDFVKQLYKHVMSESKIDDAEITYRRFAGTPKGVRILNMKMNSQISMLSRYIEKGTDPDHDFGFYEDTYTTYGIIRTNGNLEFVLSSSPSATASRTLPVEFLIARSEFYKGKDERISENYQIMAELQGRNVFL